MIKPFRTNKAIRHFINEDIGVLLSLPDTEQKSPTSIAFYKQKDYLLGICDWCGTRQIIDDPAPDDDAPINTGECSRRVMAFVDGLNWVVGHTWPMNSPTAGQGRQFCSRKCRSQHDADVAGGGCSA